jgi:signal transduction histidine kinase
LPDGSGMDMVRFVKEHRPNLPIVMMTGHGNKATIVEALKLGVYDYLEKPFSIEGDLAPVLQRLSRELFLSWENAQLTEQMLHSEKLVAIGELAAIVLHDVRGPISAILFSCEELEDEVATEGVVDSRFAKEHVVQVRKALSRISTLAEHLRSFSRSDTTRDEGFFSLRALLEDSVYLVQQKVRRLQVHVELLFEAGLENAELRCVANRFEQMLMNLFSNACDAMAEGDRRDLFVSVSKESECLVISVKDTGAGMPPEVRGRLFESFFTTKAPGKGTGLGMKVIRDVALQHGAEIEIRSEVGDGTEFRVKFPLGRFRIAGGEGDNSRVA